MKLMKTMVAAAMIAAYTVTPANAGMKGYVSSTIQTKKIAPEGPVSIDNAFQKTYLEFSDDSWSFYGLNQYDHKKDKTVENDLAVNKKIPFGMLGYERWAYDGGNYDDNLVLTLAHKGFGLRFSKILHGLEEGLDEGYYAKLSYSTKLEDIFEYLSDTHLGDVTTSVSGTWVDGFYGLNGFVHSRIGLSKKIDCRYFNVNVMGEHQESFDTDVPDTDVIGIGIEKVF